MLFKHGRLLALLFAALLFPLTVAAQPGGPPDHARAKGKSGKGKPGKGKPGKGKHAEKRAEKAEKRAEKADKRAEKRAEKAEKRAEKADKRAEKRAEKGEERAEKAEERAEKRAEKAEERAEKRAEKAEERAEKVEERGEKAGQAGEPPHAGSKGELDPRRAAARTPGGAKDQPGERVIGEDMMGKEMRKHLKRLAQIERLEDIAVRTNNEALKTKAAMIREKEMRRHARAMANIGGKPAPIEEAPPPAQPDSLPSKAPKVEPTPTLKPTPNPKLDPMPQKDTK